MHLGPSHLLVSTSSPLIKNNLQNQAGESDSHPGLPNVAERLMVAADRGDVGGTPVTSATLQASNVVNSRGTSTILGTTRGTSYFRSQFRVTNDTSELSVADEDFLSHHLASNTSSGYGYSWKKFVAFCQTISVDPFSCPPAVIVKYLRNMYEKGLSYRYINFVRSTISKLHRGFGLVSAGEHTLVKQACKAVFRLRPPLPRYKTTFDMKPVLSFTKDILGNNELLSVQWLTFKTIFLISFSSLSRISTISRLGAAVEEHPGHLVIPILSLEKQARGVYEIIHVEDHDIFSCCSFKT